LRSRRPRERRGRLPKPQGEREGAREGQDAKFRAAGGGGTGIAFKEFARWLSPFGWSRRDLPPVLRELREEGLAELKEDASGEILEVRVTDLGERELASLATEP